MFLVLMVEPRCIYLHQQLNLCIYFLFKPFYCVKFLNKTVIHFCLDLHSYSY